jgi:hypothetical protein
LQEGLRPGPRRQRDLSPSSRFGPRCDSDPLAASTTTTHPVTSRSKTTPHQADKKALLTKAMFQEVKDAADARRSTDDSLRALAAGCPVAATLQADLTYEYADV